MTKKIFYSKSGSSANITFEDKSQFEKHKKEIELREKLRVENYQKRKKEIPAIVIDIDGVLAEERDDFQIEKSKVVKESVEWINFLYETGFTIKLDSTRYEQDRLKTQNWLKENGFKYHYLYMNKPTGVLYINKDCHRFNGWKNTIKELRKRFDFVNVNDSMIEGKTEDSDENN